MYIFDFFKRMTRKANLPVLIYLVLNVFIIGYMVQLLLGGGLNGSENEIIPFWQAMLMGLVIYIISLVIALSPLGEWMLRVQTGCKKIERVEIKNYIEPIFEKVLAEARREDPSIPEDVKIFINGDESANAFATGRKTVCITEGMLGRPREEIEAALAHEFGHLAHKDTDLILVVAVGNLIVTGFILGIRIVIELVHIFIALIGIMIGGGEGLITIAANALYRLLMIAIVAGLTWLWTKIGVVLVMKSSRANEFEADAFAYKLGYGNELCALIDSFDSSNTKGLFANLASSHPDKHARIARLQEMGATYRLEF